MEIGEDVGNLRPPRLEDAGLEDCALPPDAINEAFLKAAHAVRLRDGDGDDSNSIDAPIGQDPYPKPGSGGVPEVVGDEAAPDLTEKIEVDEEGGKSCVDGLRGLEIGEKKHDDDDDKIFEV